MKHRLMGALSKGLFLDLLDQLSAPMKHRLVHTLYSLWLWLYWLRSIDLRIVVSVDASWVWNFVLYIYKGKLWKWKESCFYVLCCYCPTVRGTSLAIVSNGMCLCCVLPCRCSPLPDWHMIPGNCVCVRPWVPRRSSGLSGSVSGGL